MGGGIYARGAAGRPGKRELSCCQHRDRTRKRALLEGAVSVYSCLVGHSLPFRLSLTDFARRCGVRCVRVAQHNNTITALYTDADGNSQLCESTPRLVLYSSDTPDLIDFINMVKTAKIGCVIDATPPKMAIVTTCATTDAILSAVYELTQDGRPVCSRYDFHTADADSLIKTIAEAKRLFSPGGRGFESIALACHGPPEYKESELAHVHAGAFEWSISELVSVRSAKEISDNSSPCFRVLHALADAVVDEGRVDLFACSLLGTEMGRDIFHSIERETKTNFSASADATGNPSQPGADWVMESDGIDVFDMYFHPSLAEAFTGTFGKHASLTASAVSITAATASRGDTTMIEKTGAPDQLLNTGWQESALKRTEITHMVADALIPAPTLTVRHPGRFELVQQDSDGRRCRVSWSCAQASGTAGSSRLHCRLFREGEGGLLLAEFENTSVLNSHGGEHCACELALPEPGWYTVEAETTTVRGARIDGSGDRGFATFMIQALVVHRPGRFELVQQGDDGRRCRVSWSCAQVSNAADSSRLHCRLFREGGGGRLLAEFEGAPALESRGIERRVETALIRSLETGDGSGSGGGSGDSSLHNRSLETVGGDCERRASQADIESGDDGGGGGGGGGGLREGFKVEARYRAKTHHYPGRITRDHGDGTYDINYDDGEHYTCELALPEPGCYIVEAEMVTIGGAEPDGADRGGATFSVRVNQPEPQMAEIVIATETVEMHSLHVGHGMVCSGGWHYRQQPSEHALSSRVCDRVAFFVLDGNTSSVDKIEYSLVPTVSSSLFAAFGISVSGGWTEVALTRLFVDSSDRADRASGSFEFEQPNAGAELRLRAYSRGELVAQTSTRVAPAPRIEFRSVKLERTSRASTAISFNLSGGDAVTITNVKYSVLQKGGYCVATGTMPIRPSHANQALLSGKLECGGYAIVLNGMREDGRAVLTQVEVAELADLMQDEDVPAAPEEARTESLCVRQVAAHRFRLVWANEGLRTRSLKAMKYQCLSSASKIALAGEVLASASGAFEFDAELDPGSYAMIVSMEFVGALESRKYELPLQVRSRVDVENLVVVAHTQLSAGWRVAFALRGHVELLAEVEYAIVVANDDGEYGRRTRANKLQWIALTEAERASCTFVFIAPAGLTTRATVYLRAWTNDVCICYGQTEFAAAVQTALPPTCRPVAFTLPSTAPVAPVPERPVSNDHCGHRLGTGLTKCPICTGDYENPYHLSPYAAPVTKASRKLQQRSNLDQLHENVAHAATLGRYATSSSQGMYYLDEDSRSVQSSRSAILSRSTPDSTAAFSAYETGRRTYSGTDGDVPTFDDDGDMTTAVSMNSRASTPGQLAVAAANTTGRQRTRSHKQTSDFNIFLPSSTRTAVVLGAVVLDERDGAAVSSGSPRNRSRRRGN